MSTFPAAPRALMAARPRRPIRYAPPFIALLSPLLLPNPAVAQTQFTPVTVTAPRFAEDPATLPFGVSVLTAEQLRAAGVTSVNEAIMKLLGVPGRLDFYGGGDYALDLRGFGSTADNNQVVVVDGIRINEADSGGTRLAGIAIDSVERIEVIHGSGAVLYGEGATGGVIVITTKAGRGEARRNQADLYAAGGSLGLRELRGTGTVVAGDFSLDASANKRDSDNQRANFRSKTDGAALTGQWRNDWLRVGVRTAYDHLDSGLPGSLSTAEYATDPHRTDTPLDHATIRNNRSGVFGEATLGDWQVGLDAGWRTKSLSSSSPTDGDYAYDVDASTYALRVRNTSRFSTVANSVVAGIDHDAWKRDVAGPYGSTAHEHSQAYYLRDELMLEKGTRLSAGARTERVSKDNSGSTADIDERPVAWELGLVQPLAAGVSLVGRYGHSFRLANVDEFGFTTPGTTLQTQTSRDAELGGRWQYGTGHAELRFYRSALRHEIGYDPNAIGPSSAVYGFNGANVNFDPTRRQGVELEVMQALAAAANLRVNAAARRARFSSGPYSGEDVPLTPRYTASVRADWSPVAGHRIDAGLMAVSSQSPDFSNACRMPSYTTADLRYAYHWRVAELALAVDNLTDRKYYTQAFGCAVGAVTSIYPEAGRTLTASLRLHF